MSMEILAVNLGATSTKVAYYIDEDCKKKETLVHDSMEVNAFIHTLDQYEYRVSAVREFILREDIKLEDLDAIVSRGGHTRPIPGGVYLINDVMLDEIRSGRYGRHPCDIGCLIAAELCEELKALPLVVDPPVTDEFDDVARISGLEGIDRVSRFHALNQKATGREAALLIGKPYEELNLIVVHIGGGASVCAHKKGRMVDVNNALEGEGPYSADRSGALCATDVVRLCFKKGYTQEQVMKLINGQGGLLSYLGTADLKEIESMISQGDERAKKYLDGMCYQISKEIGAMATVLKGDIDGIVLTGGMVNSKLLTQAIVERISFLAEVYLLPGENEMKALALGALRGLRKESAIHILKCNTIENL